jgi:hypothetical protein
VNFGKLKRGISIQKGRITPSESWDLRESPVRDMPARLMIEAKEGKKRLRTERSQVRLPVWSKMTEPISRMASALRPP